MDLKNNVNALSLLYDGLVKGRQDFAKIPFHPQKTELLPPDAAAPFPHIAPERAGIDGRAVRTLIKAISASRDAEIHSMILLGGGGRIFSASAPGYDTRMPHATFSMCKTVTGLAVGMLVEEGLLSLSDPIYKFFPEEKPLLLSPRTRAITVEHLLTMTSGVAFNEPGAVVETEWIRSFLESSVAFAPGKKFAYNSMNSYMLAAIVTRITQGSLSDFLKKRLFDPLGIESFLWEKSPEGIEKGGWGLYLSAEAMAKLGMLFLNRGVYLGRRIIGRRWIDAATSAQISVPDAIGHYDYGYHMWVDKRGRAALMNGMLGQNVRIDYERGTVLVLTAGDTCLFQTAHSLLLAEAALCTHRRVRRFTPFSRVRTRLLSRRFGWEGSFMPYGAPHDREAKDALERFGIFAEHTVSTNNTGLLPFLTRLVQNNHSGCLRAVTLREEEHRILLTFSEKDESYTVPVGDGTPEESSITVHGEHYRTAACYAYARDEARRPILKIQISFPELASTRRLVLRIDEGHLTLTLTETPGFRMIEKLVTSPHLPSDNTGFLDFIKEKMNLDALPLRIRTTYEPTLRLRSVSKPIERRENDPLYARPAIVNTTVPSLVSKAPVAPAKPRGARHFQADATHAYRARREKSKKSADRETREKKE